MAEPLYVLSVSSGSWDDFYRLNVGVFESKEKAEEAGKQFLQIREKLISEMQARCPIEFSSHLKIKEDFDFEIMESLDQNTLSEYHLWHYKFNRLNEVNEEYRIEPLYINTMDLSEVFPKDDEDISL